MFVESTIWGSPANTQKLLKMMANSDEDGYAETPNQRKIPLRTQTNENLLKPKRILKLKIAKWGPGSYQLRNKHLKY